MSAKTTNTKKITLLGMLAAIAYAVIFVCHFLIPPVAGFLTLDVKDTIIAIAGFIFGPLSAALVGVVVAAVEMVTISATGPIGLVMNILSSCCFACVAAFIYKRKHTLKGAITGLIVGCLSATAVMLLWNFLITPIYMGVPRETVAAMLVPVFLPFNLGKYILNAACWPPPPMPPQQCSGSATWAPSWSPWSCSSPASWASWPGRVCCDTVTCPLLLLNVNSSEKPTLWVGFSFLPTQAFFIQADFSSGFYTRFLGLDSSI